MLSFAGSWAAWFGRANIVYKWIAGDVTAALSEAFAFATQCLARNATTVEWSVPYVHTMDFAGSEDVAVVGVVPQLVEYDDGTESTPARSLLQNATVVGPLLLPEYTCTVFIVTGASVLLVMAACVAVGVCLWVTRRPQNV